MEALDLEKKKSLLNLIRYEPDIDKKKFLYAKHPCETKHQFLINKRETTGLKFFNHSKAFIEYSNEMDHIYKNIKEYNPKRKRKILIAFDMIADMVSNIKPYPLVTELFVRGIKLNTYLVFITILFCCNKKYYTKSYNILLLKFQIIESFNKLHLTIHQILTLNIL